MKMKEVIDNVNVAMVAPANGDPPSWSMMRVTYRRQSRFADHQLARRILQRDAVGSSRDYLRQFGWLVLKVSPNFSKNVRSLSFQMGIGPYVV